MIIGIVEAQKTRNIFSKIKIKEKFGENPVFIVVEIPVFKDKISKKGLEKAEKLLKSQNADEVLYTTICKGFLTEEFVSKKITHIPSRYIWKALWFAIRKVSDDNSVKRFRAVEIVDKNLKETTYEVLAKLGGYVKYITVTTLNDYIYIISDKLISDYGVCIEIRKERKNSYLKSDTILVDIDCGRVLVGDFVIDGIELDVDTRGYVISIEDLAEIIHSSKKDELNVKNWYSGKNRIKIC